MNNLDRLLLNASPPLSTREPVISEQLRILAGSLINDLLNMLHQRNGFYAFERALHVFPSHSTQHEIGLDDWNNSALWINDYKGMADNCLFFAEDIFGSQFCIKDNQIFIFDPETGELSYLADDIEGWAKEILSDYEVLTGYPLAHQWQQQNGQLPSKMRLLPKVPFVMGGEFVLENLHLVDAVSGMKFRADIAIQIKDLPDGDHVQINIID